MTITTNQFWKIFMTPKGNRATVAAHSHSSPSPRLGGQPLTRCLSIDLYILEILYKTIVLIWGMQLER